MLNKLIITLFSFFVAGSALADQPRPWQIAPQEAASPIMHNLISFHNLLLVVIFAVAIFVTILLGYVCVRFSAKNNPTPSKTSHNTLIEIIWTVVPVIILVLVCIPSLRLLYFIETVEDTDMTIKVIGNQWYWSYQYPEYDIDFDSYIVADEDLKEGDLRLLEVDNRVVLPINTKIRIQTTAADVIHNWAIPAFGIKMDAVPGRLNEGWTEIEKTGVYYGQCSELCGVGHGFMPIAIEAVTKEQFKQWVRSKNNKLAEAEASKQIAAK